MDILFLWLDVVVILLCLDWTVVDEGLKEKRQRKELTSYLASLEEQ
jgi:hypothetical protein